MILILRINISLYSTKLHDEMKMKRHVKKILHRHFFLCQMTFGDGFYTSFKEIQKRVKKCAPKAFL